MNIYYKLNNGFYNLYAVVCGHRIQLKLQNKYDFKIIKVLIDVGAIKELPAINELKKGDNE